MGACDSLGEEREKRSGIISMGGLSDGGRTNAKYCYEKGDYILPTSICKRDDVMKYYSLSSKVLGSGASGQVYIGERNGMKYAVKRISKAKIKYADEAILEAKISLSLRHPNIIKYYEIFEDLKFITYIMDLGDGGDLFDFITGCPTGHLPSDIAIDLLIQMFDVIAYLHSVGIMHRDLKPENFMISINASNKPILKLIDFGLATYIPQGDNKVRQFVGTPEYAAPEICSKSGYREKVDEWALGVIMFNMLTGFEPFNGRDRDALKDNICYGTIQFNYIQDEELRMLNARLLERIINRRISSREALALVRQIKQRREMGSRCMSPQVRGGNTQSFSSSIVQSTSQNSLVIPNMNFGFPKYSNSNYNNYNMMYGH